MAASDILLCSRALLMVGAAGISSLAGDSPEELSCAELYPMVCEDLFSRYRWRFATKQVQLQRLVEVPKSRFSASYQIPVEARQGELYDVRVNDKRIEFDRVGRHIYCDAAAADEVIAEVGIRPNETYWPAYFNTLVSMQLASLLAIALCEDTQKAALYEGKALRQFGLAKTLDAQARTARKLPVGGLKRYHGGGAPRSGVIGGVGV